MDSARDRLASRGLVDTDFDATTFRLGVEEGKGPKTNYLDANDKQSELTNVAH